MRRKTSSLERYMLFFGRQFPLNFGVKCAIEGPFNGREGERALRALVSRHAVLFSHQEYTQGKQMDMVFPENPPIILKEVFDTGPWADVLLSRMTYEFNPFTGPLFSLDWRRTPKGAELFFVFQHGAADGIAATWFIHDFLTVLGGGQVDAPASPNMPTLYEALKEEVTAELLTRPEPDWKKEDPPPPKPFDMPPHTVPDFFLRFFTLSPAGTARLASEAKAAGQTVNSFLGARVLKASADIFASEGNATRTFQCPVDFRQYLKEKYRSVNGVYNGIVKVPVDCSQDLAVIAETIRAGVLAQREGMKDIEEYFHFRDSFDNVADPESLMMGFPPDPMDYDFSFSNLGRTVLAPSYGPFVLQDFYGPVFTAVNGETVIGLNTTNGSLRMSLIFDKKIDKAAGYLQLGNRIQEIFTSFED